jgi:membrane-associated protease RseP (regulator of RpoE activity)
MFVCILNRDLFGHIIRRVSGRLKSSASKRIKDISLDAIITLAIIIAIWFLFFSVVKLFKLESEGLEVTPYYAIVKSTALNGIITKLALWKPKAWKVLGNIGVVSAVGQGIFATYMLTSNFLRFFLKPETASPVQPLIPGVTISASSLPWFLLAAGIVILTHELSHGIQCVMEGVKVKSAAALYAIITFGGAVEPDEDDLKQASLISRMRIFASGSLINLITGILTIFIGISVGKILPDFAGVFLGWLYFVSINLAVMNMLPLGPLDGGQMWKAATDKMRYGKQFQLAATYGILFLIVGNIALSLGKFGLIPI